MMDETFVVINKKRFKNKATGEIRDVELWEVENLISIYQSGEWDEIEYVHEGE